MERIKRAVLLTAGLGSRLRPLTDEEPKCLTEVNGRPIILQTLEILEQNGIQETTIVVGYLGDNIIDKVGEHLGNMSIRYVWNKKYNETNSMYSAWLARSEIEKGAILIEGDTVFEESLVQRALERDDGKSYWVLDRFRPDYDGSMSIADAQGRIKEIKIVRCQLTEYQPNFYKSTGILKINSDYGILFSKWLDEEVKKDNVNIYYDLVIAKHLTDKPLYVLDITGSHWMEIDCIEDLKRTEKIFRPTKYALIIIDGAADLPIPELGDKTPLEYANIQNLNALAAKGHTGLMRTMYPGLPIGSIVACMGILGYNPLRYYPNGRASFEALAQNIYLKEDEIAFRCNLVSVRDGKLTDFTSKNISDELAKEIINRITCNPADFDLYPSQSYRNLLIAKRATCNATEIKCPEPHMNVGKPIDDLIIKFASPAGETFVAKLNKFVKESISQLESINRSFKSEANMLALWSPSSEPELPSFNKKYGIDAAVICGLDFFRGIAIAMRMETRKIKNATGYSDTDLVAKYQHAINSLKYSDLVVVHVNAPDEESHIGNVQGKVKILEKIDTEIIGPLKEYMDKTYEGNYRMAVLPDHYTFLKNGQHSDHLVPYIVYGKDINKDDVYAFNEKEVSRKSRTIIKSFEFMDLFLQKKW